MDADSLTVQMADRDEQMRELAALRRENAMLRETLDAIDGTVVVYGPDLDYCFANRRYHDLFPHLPPDAALRGRSYAEVLALSVAAGAVPDPAAAANPAGFVARRIVEMQDRSQEPREVHYPDTDRWAQIRVKWTPGGHRVALRIDITELKRLQQERLRAQRMETIGRIAGGAAHDFNNLLTVIVSNLEMIGMNPTDPVRVGALAASGLEAAESGARLIRQLLTFAHRDMARPRVMDPNLLLGATADLLRRTAGPGIAFEMTLSEDIGLACFDPSQFESAVLNLVLNAREALDRVGGTGRLVLASRRAAPDSIAITVSDTGPGMTADVAAQAFEPFFTTKPVGMGPGLGLSQVYGFTTGAGGTAQIDSVPGRTAVTILLPRVS